MAAPLPLLSYAWLDDMGAGGPEEDELKFLETDIKDLPRIRVGTPSMDTVVSTVSKQPSTVGRSAAAVFVVTPDMIRRSGATCLPEVLRIVPGVFVSRYSSHGWSVSMRGPHLQYSREVLLLIDGRTIYNTIYAGVYWDVEDLVLEDIERIEVIRGPGGTLWGANAVTGVINVITKNARDTQGPLVTSGGGNLDQSISQVRVGGSNGEGLTWRIYGKHFERGTEYLAGGAHDDWRVGRGGFRADWRPGQDKDRQLTVVGNFYGGEEGNEWVLTTPLAPPYYEAVIGDDPVAGANVLARWKREFDEDAGYSLQMYFDRAYRNEYILGHMQTSFDVELDHHFALGERHEFVWGLRSRQTHTDILRQTFDASMTSREDTFRMFSGFVQDRVTLVEDKLIFTIGTKLENNSYSGFEFQPSARLLSVLDDRHVVWGAISRAVRLPAFGERYGLSNVSYVPSALPAPLFFRVVGDEQVEAETMIAYEMGYRAQTSDRLSWDLNVYFNAYENLIGTTDGTIDYDFANNCYFMPSVVGNTGRGQGYGLELNGQWAVSDTWRLSGWYSLSRLDLRVQPGTNPYVVIGTERSVPRHQAQLRSQWDLGNHWEFDAALRYVDSIGMTAPVPSYITMDLRLGWRPSKQFEVALVGTNLLDDHHPEYAPTPLIPVVSEVRRTVYAQVMWQR
ncbi:MAG: TonB-dependent receptor [Pirellulales bacterium]|nr:TonB-dependent receptor [Pirellulales bacterium]